jgi:hypothetical protein
LAWAGAKRRMGGVCPGRSRKKRKKGRKKEGRQGSPQDPGTDVVWLSPFLFFLSFSTACLACLCSLPRVPSHVLNPPIASDAPDPVAQPRCITPSLDAAGVTFRFSYSLWTGLALATLGAAPLTLLRWKNHYSYSTPEPTCHGGKYQTSKRDRLFRQRLLSVFRSRPPPPLPASADATQSFRPDLNLQNISYYVPWLGGGARHAQPGRRPQRDARILLFTIRSLVHRLLILSSDVATGIGPLSIGPACLAALLPRCLVPPALALGVDQVTLALHHFVT